MKSPKAVATCPQDQTSSAHSNTHSTTSKCSSLAKIPTQHQDTPWAYPFPHNPAYAHCHAASPTFSKNCPPTSASQPPQTATSPHGRDKAWHCSTESLASNPETLALTAKKGWETITETAIRALAQRNTPLVAILWGKDAQTTQAFLGKTPVITSPHPSPLSASRGFFGSRPFSRANTILEQLGTTPINWEL